MYDAVHLPRVLFMGFDPVELLSDFYFIAFNVHQWQLFIRSKGLWLDRHTHFAIQIIDSFSDLRPIGPPHILFYLKCRFNAFVGLVQNQVIYKSI